MKVEKEHQDQFIVFQFNFTSTICTCRGITQYVSRGVDMLNQ